MGEFPDPGSLETSERSWLDPVPDRLSHLLEDIPERVDGGDDLVQFIRAATKRLIIVMNDRGGYSEADEISELASDLRDFPDFAEDFAIHLEKVLVLEREGYHEPATSGHRAAIQEHQVYKVTRYGRVLEEFDTYISFPSHSIPDPREPKGYAFSDERWEYPDGVLKSLYKDVKVFNIGRELAMNEYGKILVDESSYNIVRRMFLERYLPARLPEKPAFGV